MLSSPVRKICLIRCLFLIFGGFSTSFGNPIPSENHTISVLPGLSPGTTDSTAVSPEYFYYIDFYGKRYNKTMKGYVDVITAVQLPVALLTKIPRLKNHGIYSKKNQKILKKQQEIIRSAKGNTITIRVNRKKVTTFYPDGLKKGFIIELEEFSKWDFIEKPTDHIDPIQKSRENENQRFYFDPIDPYYGFFDDRS